MIKKVDSQHRLEPNCSDPTPRPRPPARPGPGSQGRGSGHQAGCLPAPPLSTCARSGRNHPAFLSQCVIYKVGVSAHLLNLQHKHLHLTAYCVTGTDAGVRDPAGLRGP